MLVLPSRLRLQSRRVFCCTPEQCSIALPRIICFTPSLVRIVAFHRFSSLCRVWAEILLVDDSVVANDEGLHPSYPILCRPGHQPKAADHCSLDYVIQLAQTRCRALPLQYLEVIPV